MSTKIKRQEVWDPDAYKIKIEIADVEFEFQCPDRATLDEVGIPLLKNTFGRYKDFEVKKAKK